MKVELNGGGYDQLTKLGVHWAGIKAKNVIPISMPSQTLFREWYVQSKIVGSYPAFYISKQEITEWGPKGLYGLHIYGRGNGVWHRAQQGYHTCLLPASNHYNYAVLYYVLGGQDLIKYEDDYWTKRLRRITSIHCVA